MRPYVSFSEVQLFRNGCQWRWKLDYLDQNKRQNYGVHLDFGTAIHAAIERHKTRENPCSVDDAVAEFKKRFNTLWDMNRQSYSEGDRKQDPAFFLSAGENILRHFHECKELAEAEVLYNEHALFVPIDRTDQLDIKFKGYIDMVVKTKDKRGKTILYVIDFKSCSWGWDREKRSDQDLHSQLFLYKHFLCKKFDIEPSQVWTAFVLLKKSPRKGDAPVEFLPISAGPVSVQRAVDGLSSTITDMASRVESGDLRKNREECVNRFGQRCPYLDSTLCPSQQKT